MVYGRLGASESDPGGGGGGGSTDGTSFSIDQPQHTKSYSSSTRKKKILFLSILSLALIVASAVSAVLLIGIRTKASGQPDPNNLTHRKPTQAISKTCSKTRYPTLCVDSLLDFPGSLSASETDLVHISFNMTLQHFNKALYLSTAISYQNMDTRVRSAFDDCLELLEDSIDALSRSLSSVMPSSGGGSAVDVVTWLSAALTNQDTCTEGFEGVDGDVKNQMSEKLKDLTELASNCLAIFSATNGDDFSGVPIQNRRRLMSVDDISDEEKLPSWLGRKERRLLSLPVSAIQADIVVSADGNGTFKTIAEAIKKAPEYSSRRTIVYVRAGR